MPDPPATRSTGAEWAGTDQQLYQPPHDGLHVVVDHHDVELVPGGHLLLIAATYQHNLAKAEFARAIGQVEARFLEFVGGK